MTSDKVRMIQEKYSNLFLKGKVTKQDICDLGVQFRDYYNLSDLDTLRIMRQELNKTETNKILTTGILKNANKVMPYVVTIGSITYSLWWFTDYFDKTMALVRANELGYCRDELVSCNQLKRAYKPLKWLEDMQIMTPEMYKLLKQILLEKVAGNPEYKLD